MRLQDVLDQIKFLSDDKVVFVRKPWTLNAEAVIDELDADLRVPAAIKSKGLDYFMEVSVANEVLEVFEGRAPTIDEQRALLMYYAENDAYPDWVYGS